jgi:hypothetical protein
MEFKSSIDKITVKKFMDKTKSVKLPKLYRQPATRLGAPLVEKAEQRLGELSAECKWPTNRHLKWHLREQILPGLAIYQVLRAEGQSQEAALAAFDQIIELAVKLEQRKMARLGRFRGVYSLLRLVIRPAMRLYPAAGWKTEWLENSQDAIRFNMHSCFYFDTLSRFGAPELTASFCRGDDLIYEQMSPYIEWKRTQTIGRGAKYCDFCFTHKG